MNIVCLKWGDKFNHEHVNRLYRMVCKNFKEDFSFICHTENANGIDRNVIIQPLPDYDLENWWWKLTLFEHSTKTPTLFLDLDVVIQNDITHFKDYVVDDKIRLVKCYWKPWLENTEALIKDQFDMNINSSIMIWKGDLTDVWNTFQHDPEFYMLKYKGIDSYLYFDNSNKINFLEKGEVYSRLYGIDETRMWKPADDPSHTTLRDGYYFDANHNICIFNGWRGKRNFFDGEYALDDDGYDGMQHYWD